MSKSHVVPIKTSLNTGSLSPVIDCKHKYSKRIHIFGSANSMTNITPCYSTEIDGNYIPARAKETMLLSYTINGVTKNYFNFHIDYPPHYIKLLNSSDVNESNLNVNVVHHY